MNIGHLSTNPFIVFNMGAEMIYIIDHRLKAQKADSLKAQIVIQDITREFYSPGFVDNLFAHQKSYTISYIKQVFQKIAHSSIMKLNEQSMSKLFDLMIMGFKQQIICSNSPRQIFEITHNHFQQVLQILQNHNSSLSKAKDHLEQALNQFNNFANQFTMFDFILLRQELLRFTQEKYTRISMFLQEKIQKNDGSIVIELNLGGYLIEKPGLIRYFGQNQSILKIQYVDLQSSQNFQECPSTRKQLPKGTHLGLNLYTANGINARKQALDIQTDVKQTNTINQLSDKQITSKISQNSSNDLNQLANIIKGKSQTISSVGSLFILQNQDNTNNQIDEPIIADNLFEIDIQDYQGNLKNKINDQFADLNVNDQKSEQMDILDMMDEYGE